MYIMYEYMYIMYKYMSVHVHIREMPSIIILDPILLKFHALLVL